MEMFGAIDEKQSGFDIVFLPQFVEKEFVRPIVGVENSRKCNSFVWIHGGVQPELLVDDANHGFVNRNLIRSLPADRL